MPNSTILHLVHMHDIVITLHRQLNNSTTINQFQVLGAELNAGVKWHVTKMNLLKP